jgi:hypothetical protein
MSVHTDLVEVVCDGPDSTTRCPDSAAMANYGTASSVRATLRSGEDPWRTGLPGGIDRCGKCRRQAAATTGSSPSEGATP